MTDAAQQIAAALRAAEARTWRAAARKVKHAHNIYPFLRHIVAATLDTEAEKLNG